MNLWEVARYDEARSQYSLRLAHSRLPVQAVSSNLVTAIVAILAATGTTHRDAGS